jgi:hypothetical protein
MNEIKDRMENMIDELNEDTEPEEIKFISLK